MHFVKMNVRLPLGFKRSTLQYVLPIYRLYIIITAKNTHYTYFYGLRT